MSEDDWAIPTPTFRPAEALAALERTLRDLKLTQRAGGFDCRQRRAVELQVDADVLVARMARRLVGSTPDWDTRRLASAADVRRWTDELRQRLVRWQRDDD